MYLYFYFTFKSYLIEYFFLLLIKLLNTLIKFVNTSFLALI